MKKYFKQNALDMKTVIFVCSLMLSLSSFAQQQQRGSSITDPSLGSISMTDRSDRPLDATNLDLYKLVKLRIPLSNEGALGLPAGSCKIKIGLGSKMILDPGFLVNDMMLNQYFAWSAVLIGSQWQLTGDLVADLPGGLTSIPVMIRIIGKKPGNSTITANFLVTNHHTKYTLSDQDPTNNSSYLAYTLKAVIPPAFSKMEVVKNDCNINVSFSTEREFNVSRYEIEVSRDNSNFTMLAGTDAHNLLHYTNSFALTESMKAPLLFVRIKSIQTDGKIEYSETKSVVGNCDAPWVLSIYPNPVKDLQTVTVSATQGVFSGKYRVILLDAGGKLMQSTEMELNYTNKFNYSLGMIGAGHYILQVISTKGSQSAVLKFEKL